MTVMRALVIETTSLHNSAKTTAPLTFSEEDPHQHAGTSAELQCGTTNTNTKQQQTLNTHKVEKR